MWSEEQDNMDNRIRKAADSITHSVDENHWEKMETLLNEHLPEEKKRRRFLFILLLAGLLTGTAVVTMITVSNKKTIVSRASENPIETSSNTKQTKSVTNSNTSTSIIEKNTQTGTTIIQDEEKGIITTTAPTDIKRTTLVENKKALTTTTIKTERKYSADKSLKEKKKKEKSQNSFTNQNNDDRNTITDFVNNTSIPDVAEKSVSATKDTQVAIAVIETPANTINEEKKEDSTNIAADTKEEEKSNLSKKKPGKFSVLLSAGSDISGIGTKAGSPQIAYGIGVGYTISDKLTLRTGIVAAVKKYDAQPEQYHPDNYNFWVYYPRLQKINADCFVYEIPLSVIYNFKTTKNHNWFVSTGLSSFIMKRETYGYTYKDNWGQTRYTTRTYKDEYKHWFSVLNLSGGYQYHFNNKFSLLAEPYIKMPLAGVGFGHVKLNSAGILITAAIKPFSKKEK